LNIPYVPKNAGITAWAGDAKTPTRGAPRKVPDPRKRRTW
jgi:hypothetical protein